MDRFIGFLLTVFVVAVLTVGFTVIRDLNDGRVRDMIIN